MWVNSTSDVRSSPEARDPAPNLLVFDADGDTVGVGLERMLGSEALDVRAITTAEDLLSSLSRTRPDLIVIAAEHPASHVVDLVRVIRARDDDVGVLVRTRHADEADRVLALRAGADDLVLQSSGLMELLARVEALLRRARRRPPAHDTVVTFSDVRVDTTSGTVTKAGRRVHLRPKEFELLALLIRRRGVMLSRERLLKDVWGHRVSVATRTLDSHIFSLRRKLEEVPEAPRHLITVRSRGYRFDP